MRVLTSFVLDDNSLDDQDIPIKEPNEKKKNVVQWQVDLAFKKEQERLKIPSDPIKWYCS